MPKSKGYIVQISSPIQCHAPDSATGGKVNLINRLISVIKFELWRAFDVTQEFHVNNEKFQVETRGALL